MLVLRTCYLQSNMILFFLFICIPLKACLKTKQFTLEVSIAINAIAIVTTRKFIGILQSAEENSFLSLPTDVCTCCVYVYSRPIRGINLRLAFSLRKLLVTVRDMFSHEHDSRGNHRPPVLVSLRWIKHHSTYTVARVVIKFSRGVLRHKMQSLRDLSNALCLVC